MQIFILPSVRLVAQERRFGDEDGTGVLVLPAHCEALLFEATSCLQQKRRLRQNDDLAYHAEVVMEDTVVIVSSRLGKRGAKTRGVERQRVAGVGQSRFIDEGLKYGP